ncbi:MAG: carbon-phosphorus lyase complex subunit PhnI [Desulfotalea sp.]
MYVAVKGGEKAIKNGHQALAKKRRGDTSVPLLTVKQIMEQLPHAVDRVMTEGSLYDPELAALAIKQACGDTIEAIFLLRAFRTTMPRLISTEPINTDNIQLGRRISAAFKDTPGGQMLGPTFDYTHRLLDFSLLDEVDNNIDIQEEEVSSEIETEDLIRVLDLLHRENLVEPSIGHTELPKKEPNDLTREPLLFPVDRDIRLQNLARADEGFILSMGYSTQRGYKSADSHPFVAEMRIGHVELEICPEELGFNIVIGEIEITEGEVVSIYDGSDNIAPEFVRGYGLTFGYGERKAIAMALVDRALRCRELEEDIESPTQDEEFIMSHSDNVQATGFVEHLKLPHHVDFQSELEILRRLKDDWQIKTERQQQLINNTSADN